MFRASDVMIINKIDQLPYVEFNIDQCIKHTRSVYPDIKIFQLSATKGDGLDNWYNWLTNTFKINGESVAAL